MKEHVLYDKRKEEFRRYVAASYKELSELRAADKRKEFNEKLITLLPAVKRYITRGLRLALSKGVISHNKYKPDDFFDQLFIEVYDHLEDVPSADAFHAWLFKRAEKLLEDMEVEEIFEAYYNENVEDYYQAELEKLDESFSTDGDGDLILLTDLDDISYRDHHYILRNIYLDDAHEDLMALMDTERGQKKVKRYLDTALYGMPADARSVFELATLEGFSSDEIARIKSLDEAEVEELLENARDLLRDQMNDRLFES